MTSPGPPDTIAAVATAPGAAGIAVVRVSGPQAFQVAARRFRPAGQPGPAPTVDTVAQWSHRARYGHWFASDAPVDTSAAAPGPRALDDVVLTVFRAPRSYTGEDTIEISCHGSRYLQESVLASCLSAGARLARPGEFTERAFLSGRLDLSQAEAVADLIAAESSAAHRLAATQLGGAMRGAMSELRAGLIAFAALIELENDFGEEDVAFANRDSLLARVETTRATIAGLIASFRRGRALREGVHVVLAGRPNAGKSTLLNALLDEDRAIVSPIAGTTRDTIDATVDIAGIRFRITDTAGLREAADEIEALGVARTRAALAEATAVVYVWDVALATPAEVARDVETLGAGGALIGVANKMDLNPYGLREHFATESLPAERIVPMAAAHGMNLDLLRETLVEVGAGGAFDPGEVVVSRLRHVSALEAADEALVRVADGVAHGLSGDLLALDLRQALYHIGTVTGEVGVDDLLDSIFSSFCIGK